MVCTKRIYNVSKNNEFRIYTEYPKDIQILLFIENFNFYDKNSQCILHNLSKEYPNIKLLCQIRNNFDFAANHIDNEARAGGGMFYSLE